MLNNDIDLDRLIRFPPVRTWTNIIISISLLIGFIFVGFILKSNLQKLHTAITENTTIIHDTIFIKPPKIYKCWSCSLELKGVNTKTPTVCCGLNYLLVKGELFGKKQNETNN